jgi:hypothetical protein
MEEIVPEIVLPEELVRDLPQRTRNGLEALAKHPKGLFTHELREILKVKNPFHSCFGKKELVAEYGFEVICERYRKGLEAFWKLQKIQPKVEVEVDDDKKATKFLLGDRAWSFSWPVDEFGYLNVNNLKLNTFIIENKEQLSNISMNYCFPTYRKAIGGILKRITEITCNGL